MNQHKKVIISGNGGSGKTSFVQKILTGENIKTYIATLGVEVSSFPQANVWDLAGQDKFRGNSKDYYNDVDIVIIFCDAQTKLYSLKKWLNEIPENPEKEIKIVKILNKIDVFNENLVDSEFDYQISVKNDSVEHLLNIFNEIIS